MKIRISIIICSRNRGAQLKRSLEAIENQDFKDIWELIIIDNGSTDNTNFVIDEFVNTAKCLVKTTFEPKPGLSRARNRGLSLSRGEVVAFTDDDCYPEPDYLTAIDHCFRTHNISFCGGRILLFDPTDRRITIQELNKKKAINPHLYLPSGLIRGANMAFERNAILSAHGFDERLGAGTRFNSGEDTDLLRRLITNGCSGIYDPSIVVYHHHGRKTAEAEDNLLRGYWVGRGACMAKFCVNPKTRAVYLRQWYWGLRTMRLAQIIAELMAGVQFIIACRFRKEVILNHPRESLTGKGQPF